MTPVWRCGASTCYPGLENPSSEASDAPMTSQIPANESQAAEAVNDASNAVDGSESAQDGNGSIGTSEPVADDSGVNDNDDDLPIAQLRGASKRTTRSKGKKRKPGQKKKKITSSDAVPSGSNSNASDEDDNDDGIFEASQDVYFLKVLSNHQTEKKTSRTNSRIKSKCM